MTRKFLTAAAACVLLLPLACDNSRVTDPLTPDPQYSAGGLYLRDTDADAAMPADTTVSITDAISMALAAGSGTGPQNNPSVVWTNSNPAAVSLTSSAGTAVATAQALGTSTVCAVLGGSSFCVVIHVSAGPPAIMVAHAGQGQSATVGTAVAVPPAVRVTDAFDNPVAGVEVTFTVTGGGGSVTGAVQLTDANGVATVGSWTLGNTPGPNTLDATATGLPTVTFTATATVGDAAKLAMHTQPSATAQAGVAFAQQPAVQLRDALDNDVETAGVVVTASIASGAGTLAGTLSVATDAQGRATFTDLRIDGATGTRTLRFEASGVADAVSDPVDVVAGPADHLAMVQQPSSTAQAGEAFAQQPSVRLADQFGNAVAQAGVQVDAAIASGGGTLLGTLSVNTDGTGLATFTDLAIGGTVGIRTLAFSAAGVADATSDAIDVVAGPATDILLTTPSTTVPVNTTVTITGQLRDQYGNSVPQVVSVSWSSTNGGSFSANPTSTDGAGQTTVDFTVANAGGVTHTVTATAGAASGTIDITTVNTAPTAGDDAFDAIGNVTIPVPAPGVLANDSDPEQPVSAVPGTIATTNGGTVQMSADGSFTYLSAAGFSGTDSFIYTVTDGTDVANATVTMTVAAPVWYVDNSATAPGDGRDASPFTELKSAETASSANQQIFVLVGDGTTNGMDEGIVLKNGQLLTGQGVAADITAVVNGATITLLAANGAPQVTRVTAGTTIQLAQNNTVRGLDIASTAGAGIAGASFGSFTASAAQVSANGGAAVDLADGAVNASFTQLSSSAAATGLSLTNLTGTFDAPAGSLTGTGGTGMVVAGGNADISYGGSITTVVQRPVLITGRTGGSVTVAGPIDGDGLGIRVADNSGGSVAFTGGSSITTSEIGVALSNNTGATITFSGGGHAITAVGGTGFQATGGGTISVQGAGNTIAATGTGLLVQNTNIAAAGLTFESVSASGGAIGINLVNTGTAGGLTVTGTGTPGSGGTIQNISGADGSSAGNGVWLASTGSVSLSHMQLSGFSNHAIRGTDVNGFALISSTISGTSGDNAALFEGAVVIDQLTGAAQVQNSTISGGVSDNMRVSNTSGVYTLDVDGSTFQNNHGATGRDGLRLAARGTSNATVNITNSNFILNQSFGIEALTENAGAMNIGVSGGSLQNNFVGVDLAHGSSSPFKFDVSNVPVITGQGGNAINVNRLAAPTATGLFSGTVSGNAIGTAGVPGSGSAAGSGIRAATNGATGTLTMAITGNTIREIANSRGIDIIARDGGSTLNATVTGNNILLTAPFSLEGIRIDSGALSTDTVKVCAAISGNTSVANASSRGIRIRQRFTLTAFELAGYAGAPTDNAAVIAFLAANNTSVPAPLADNGGPGFTGVASCPTPLP